MIKPTIRLIIGVIGSGKDYAAEQFMLAHPKLEYLIPHHIKISEKMVLLAEKVYQADFSTIEKYTEWKKILKNREGLVRLAESAKDIFGEDFWLNHTLVDIDRILQMETSNLLCPIFAISDFRFPFEFYRVREYCQQRNINLEIQFVNYKSDRYQLRKDQPGELLAIYLVENGYNPSIWTPLEFSNILKNYTTLHP